MKSYKLSKTFAAGIVAAALIGVLPSVQAADAGKSRAQVRAEYDEAVRVGDIVEPVSGLKLNEVYPAAYPTKPAAAAKTREEVKAEFERALHAGTIVNPETGTKIN
jgi:hypothetical protein